MRVPDRPPKKALDNQVFEAIARGSDLIQSEIDGRYLHWDELRHRPPPEGVDHATWWALVQVARGSILREFPLEDLRGRRFRFGMTDSVQRLVHSIDRDASGRIELPEDVTNRETRDRYVVSSLIEEAITSSQLEGASTTRRVAKQMLETGRPPRTHDETMIWNNFQAMEWVRGHLHTPFSIDAVLELHRIVTTDALDGGGDGAGRFRRDDEHVIVVDHDDGEALHVPPEAASLPGRMETMCRFANASDDEAPFLHPVVRAILVHFWLAFDHPFVDGNGRTARALFYWQMLRRGYWLTEFISISRVIKKARVQYARAFLFAEDGGLDATYFVLHQLGVIRQAIDDLFAYLERKTRELRDLESRIRVRADLNHRQLGLLSRALHHPEEHWTVQKHRRTSAVAYDTARNDLQSLVQAGLLIQRKVGKAFVYTVPNDLERRLRR